MHDSGRMLLAFYANGVLRLWNMLDARCIFKRKVGLSAQEDSEEDAEAGMDDEAPVEEEIEDIKQSKGLQSEKTRKVMKQFDRMNMRAE